MPTTRELIDGLERSRALFNIALEGTDLAEGGMNPLVAEDLASASPQSQDYGLRKDGTKKGNGYFGPLTTSNGDVATEYSIGVDFDGRETEIPTLVPTLTEDEIRLMLDDIIPNKKEIPESIVQKAVEHARERMGQGRSVFADENDVVRERKASSSSEKKAEAPAVSSLPFTPGVAVSVPSEDSDVAGTFYDMLMRNDAYRLANSEAFERNEKANAARTRIAAVADALASLGNLVGTTQGAFSQPQTYQTPFVTEQVEADRANARKLANALFENENSLRLAKMRMDASGSSLAEKLALQDAVSQRAAANAAARDALEEKKHGYRTAENEQKAGYTREQHDIDNAVRKDIAAGNNATSRATAATRAEATKYSADKRAETSGGGSVGGYTTTTQSEYDELGRKVRETKTRTGANGQTSSTTTTTGGKKPNPMGSAPQQGGKKKKKNPMN